MDADGSDGERPPAQAASAEASLSLASETPAQALQPPPKVPDMGAFRRFDRWFFADLGSLWH
jgi:hypothetical protein